MAEMREVYWLKIWWLLCFLHVDNIYPCINYTLSVATMARPYISHPNVSILFLLQTIFRIMGETPLNGILEAVICWEDTLQHPPGLNANRKPCTWFWTSSSGKLGSPASSLLRHWFHNIKTLDRKIKSGDTLMLEFGSSSTSSSSSSSSIIILIHHPSIASNIHPTRFFWQRH